MIKSNFIKTVLLSFIREEKQEQKAVKALAEQNTQNEEMAEMLKAEKKQAKNDIRMINVCMSEKLYTAFGYVDEMKELDYVAEDMLPIMYDYRKTVVLRKQYLQILQQII